MRIDDPQNVFRRASPATAKGLSAINFECPLPINHTPIRAKHAAYSAQPPLATICANTGMAGTSSPIIRQTLRRRIGPD